MIHTGQPISALFIDPAAMCPPYTVMDVLYVGLKDGRIMIYLSKSKHDKQTIQQVNQIKFEPPVHQFNFFTSEVVDFEPVNNQYLCCSDLRSSAVIQLASPIFSVMKKLCQQTLKQAEIDQLPVPITEKDMVFSPSPLQTITMFSERRQRRYVLYNADLELLQVMSDTGESFSVSLDKEKVPLQ